MSVIIKLLSKFDNSGIKKAQSGFSGLGKTLGALGVGFGLNSIINFAKDATKGFEQAQIASSKLSNVMESMGVGKSTKRVDAYAESLQNLVAVDADVIKGAQTQLATFGNLAMSADVTGGMFDRATVAALDLASVFGGDAKSKAVQLGKAMQDPVRGITALRKSGVDFTKQEQQKIKTLVESNRVLEAQDMILKVIEKQVGGTAAAGASVFDRMKLSMDSVSDSIGEILLPYMQDFTNFLISDVIPNVQSFFKDLSDPKSEAGQAFLNIKSAVEQTYKGVKDFFALFGDGDAMKGFGNVASELVKALPALLALKGIMVLASAGTAIANLAKAVGLISAGNVANNSPLAAVGKNKWVNVAVKAAVPLAVTMAGLEMIDEGFTKPENREALANNAKSKFPAYNPGMNKGIFISKDGKNSAGIPVNNNITINVTGGDPKVLINALKKYVSQNGNVPFYLQKPKG
jgi:hypothetical protein